MLEFLNEGDKPEKVETQAVEQAAEQSVEQPEGEAGAPTAPQNEQHIPLAALEAERKQRQDWKEKATRAEERLRVYEEQERARANPNAAPADPLQVMQQQIVNERFNTSEMLVRAKHEDADEKVEVFKEAAKANPGLIAAMNASRHPWEFAYKEGARMLMQREIGDDPTTYKARLRAEWEAEQAQKAPAAPLNLPASLNGQRSVAPRSAPAWSGPTPLDQILTR